MCSAAKKLCLVNYEAAMQVSYKQMDHLITFAQKERQT